MTQKNTLCVSCSACELNTRKNYPCDVYEPRVSNGILRCNAFEPKVMARPNLRTINEKMARKRPITIMGLTPWELLKAWGIGLAVLAFIIVMFRTAYVLWPEGY